MTPSSVTSTDMLNSLYLHFTVEIAINVAFSYLVSLDFYIQCYGHLHAHIYIYIVYMNV